eukprot:SAG31_NODE_7225_length_1750_cov_1.313749_2_plen_93_part_00
MARRGGGCQNELEIGMVLPGSALSEDQGWAEAAEKAVSAASEPFAVNGKPSLWSVLRRTWQLQLAMLMVWIAMMAVQVSRLNLALLVIMKQF